jgi:hypothetical protein
MSSWPEESVSVRKKLIIWETLGVECPFPVACHPHIGHTHIEGPPNMCMEDTRLGLGPHLVQMSNTSIQIPTGVGHQLEKGKLSLDVIPMNGVVRSMSPTL